MPKFGADLAELLAKRATPERRSAMPSRKAIDLVGVREIADRYGLDAPSASRLGQRRDFPPPEAELAMGPVWLGDVVDEWMKKRRPEWWARRYDGEAK
jgi:hypothetical protein